MKEIAEVQMIIFGYEEAVFLVNRMSTNSTTKKE